tara:strand:+ start:5899 stop:6057 length:159 start_codon:yes stop_codon:yes gene_type:complete
VLVALGADVIVGDAALLPAPEADGVTAGVFDAAAAEDAMVCKVDGFGPPFAQ